MVSRQGTYYLCYAEFPLIADIVKIMQWERSELSHTLVRASNWKAFSIQIVYNYNKYVSYSPWLLIIKVLWNEGKYYFKTVCSYWMTLKHLKRINQCSNKGNHHVNKSWKSMDFHIKHWCYSKYETALCDLKTSMKWTSNTMQYHFLKHHWNILVNN